MNTLVVYDAVGKIIYSQNGSFYTPVGISYIIANIPEGKVVKGVDVSGETHELILEDVAKSDIEVLRNEVDAAILELTMAIYMGGGL